MCGELAFYANRSSVLVFSFKGEAEKANTINKGVSEWHCLPEQDLHLVQRNLPLVSLTLILYEFVKKHQDLSRG